MKEHNRQEVSSNMELQAKSWRRKTKEQKPGGIDLHT
jgi:hypothetical protein